MSLNLVILPTLFPHIFNRPNCTTKLSSLSARIAYVSFNAYFLSSSLALISGRATLNSLEVLSMLVASYLYALCQGELYLR